jgi:cell division septation protein DedD
LWIVVVIAVLALVGAGYYFGYPMFQKYWDKRFKPVVLVTPPVDTTTVVIPEVVEVVPPEPAIAKGYYIIVGSFRNKDNADKMVQNTSGSDVKALFFEELGLYRVSIGYYDNIRQAYNNKPGMMASSGIADAWVLENN